MKLDDHIREQVVLACQRAEGRKPPIAGLVDRKAHVRVEYLREMLRLIDEQHAEIIGLKATLVVDKYRDVLKGLKDR